MKLKSYLILFFVGSFAFGQDLYVADNSYLYANDVVVFVNNDIRLETPTSNLYLRGNSQLLQNTDIKNSDIGELSIYQNQTTNIYEYNYFCSPVGVGTDCITKANVAFNGSNIHDPNPGINDITSTAYLFTSAYNGTATELSNYWMYTLESGEGYYDWQQIFNTGDVSTGYGFTLKGSPNPNNVLDFRGRPNNGTIVVNCSYDGVDDQPSGKDNYAETLTGNPYPSALDLKLFFANSANNQADLSGEIFFWGQKQNNSHYLTDYEGGYGVYIPGDITPPFADNGSYAVAAFENYNTDGSSNTNTTGNTTDYSGNNERRYAAVGQGFIIASNVLGGNAVFDNSMRVYFPEDSSPGGNGSVFGRSKNSKKSEAEKKTTIPISHNGVDYESIFENPTMIPEIRVHTHINNTFYKENVIAFRKSTPNNKSFNKFYDGRNANQLSSDAYLISDDEELVIKSINYNESVRLQLGLKSSKDNTPFSIKINSLKAVPKDVNIYLFDKENNTYTNIKNDAFEINLDEGVYNNRFEITFQQQVLSTDNNNTLESFKVYQDNNLSILTIHNPNALNIQSLTVLDVSGKKIIHNTISSSTPTYKCSTKQLSNGVYVVQTNIANQQVFTKKIVVNNKK
jgi:hypothetical protein